MSKGLSKDVFVAGLFVVGCYSMKIRTLDGPHVYITHSCSILLMTFMSYGCVCTDILRL